MSAFFPTSSELVAQRLGQVLHSLYGDFRSGAKRLAHRVGADPRAAKNWLAGSNAAQLHHAIDLMAAHPEVEAEVLSLVRARREAQWKKSASNTSWHSAQASASAGPPPAP